MIMSLLKRIVKHALHEAAEEWLVEIGVPGAAVQDLRRDRLALATAAEARADAAAAAALGIAEDDVGSPAALPLPAATRTTEPSADACPPPGDEAALMQWIARRREAKVGWAEIAKAVADAGHDVGEAGLRRRLQRHRKVLPW